MTTSIEIVLHSDEPRFIELFKDYNRWDLKRQYEMQVMLHQFEAARLSRAIGRMESGPHRGGGRREAPKG